MVTREEFYAKCELVSKEPHIWYRVPGYVIRTYSPDLEKHVIDIMINIFSKEEPCFSVNEVYNNPESVKDMHIWIRNVVKHNLTLVALPENSPGADLQPVSDKSAVIIAGVNMVMPMHKDDLKPNIKDAFNGAAFIKTLTTLKTFVTRVNVFEKFKTDAFIATAGLVVHTEHRRRGLCKALLLARFILCKELGVHVTRTVFTSKSSQKVANGCGFEVIDSERFCNLKDDAGQYLMPGCSEDYTFQHCIKIIS